ncbi:NMDA receptor-regulated protein 1-domain-containing protein [Obelidium mucronatum]|nr:NMDA receptor-regulated protein 1-domain-containing protein [Obelidium mucronatum]
MTSRKQDLPAKEAALMRQVAKFHDNKQHKKGLKTAETILKKFPEHGEALAMKALFLSGLDRREEAHEVVKKAIKNDIGNHVCWHAYGLIHRAEKNYEEVIKCYTQALRIDKENLGIFRDFASMQVQLRNMEAFVEACLSIILLRPTVKQFWLSLAASFHLSNDLDGAIQAMKNYHDLFMTYVEKGVEYENSEIHLYRAMLLEESGDLKGALEMLDSNEKSILDKRSVKETRARLLLEMGELKQAEIAYKTLFKTNPDSYSALEGLQKTKGLYYDLDEDKTNSLFELFEDLVDEHRRSNALKRIPLNYASGERFSRMADSFLRFNFQKGVPSLFMSVRALYVDQGNLEKIQELCMSYVKNLNAHSTFGEPAPSSGDDEDDIQVVEPPSAILWVYYYLAQHFDFLGDRTKALEYINLAIDHTPTLVELFMTKARILKHAGDVKQAMDVMNYGRNLDLQDRCINSKAVKYMLRAGNIEEAEKTIILFCRVDSADKLNDLVDMQCTWFAYESAMAYIGRGDYGRALKKFNTIEKFFYDIYDDQFDFHTYSIRKATMRTYIDMVRMEDRLRAHPFYFKAAIEAVKLHVFAFDKKISDDKQKKDEMSQMSESDRKKALRKAKKAELAKGDSKEDVTKSAGSVGASSSANTKDGKKKDDDPDGSKLLTEGDLLTESLKFLKPLLELSPGRIEGQILGCSVYLRRKNYLLATKCLKKGYKIDPANPELHKLTIELATAVNSADVVIHEKVKPIVLEGLESILGGADLKSFNKEFGKSYGKASILHAAALAETTALLNGDVAEAVDVVVTVSSSQAGEKSFNVENATAAHKSLLRLKAGDSQLQAYVKNCLVAFPLASYFLALQEA